MKFRAKMVQVSDDGERNGTWRKTMASSPKGSEDDGEDERNEEDNHIVLEISHGLGFQL